MQSGSHGNYVARQDTKDKVVEMDLPEWVDESSDDFGENVAVGHGLRHNGCFLCIKMIRTKRIRGKK